MIINDFMYKYFNQQFSGLICDNCCDSFPFLLLLRKCVLNKRYRQQCKIQPSREVPAINLLRSSFGTNSLVTMADSALYDVLGVSSKATDTELKKVEILKESKIDIYIFFYLKTS